MSNNEQYDPTTGALRLHHVAVQAIDLDNSIRWYRDFFGCHVNWTTSEFSELTNERLPGITRMAELTYAGVRLHLMERGMPARPESPTVIPEFQHVCISTASAEDLLAWHQRWRNVFASGRHTYARDEPPTDIVVDGDGVQSFYCHDVDGLEYEFTYVPVGHR